MTIVTSTYRYKRPPRKRIAIEAPAIVTSVDVKKLRRPATRRKATPQPANDDGQPELRPPAGKQSAIATARKHGSRRSTEPEMTPEEHKRRGDAADALWRELVQRATGGE
ncbi:MAG TPA: hypothetical protein VFL55_26255 [Acetobacteraceae bacterium]|nr:hypothetical protein [Acetobacteraceae bacterium]